MKFKWIKIGVLSVMWMANFLLSTMRHMSKPNPPPIGDVLYHDMVHWIVMIFIIPLVLFLAGKFRFERERLITPSLIYIMASVIFTAVYVYSVSCVAYGINFGDERLITHFTSELQRTAYYPQGVFWAFLAVTLILDYFKKNRDRELWASELESKLAYARLQALTMQIQPHFLFNTLNTVSSLVREKKDIGAINMLSKLGDLLRFSFENPERQEVPLAEELEFLDSYLEIEKVRFHDRLRVTMHIEDDALVAVVPSLILQPLVENAIKHGISKSRVARDIRISAATSNGHLRLEVENDGPRISREISVSSANGIGLKNTVERLKHLYGKDHMFRIEGKEGGGAFVTLEIPFSSQQTIDQA